ncbi:conjugative transposon protein TraN [Terrimonas sp.]|uniref:conjugative transposon protein TraN n=1 Tax=Terrimonas sp. TaxID=1914338 RepID=UPI000D514B6A|nr:conjugative transposon protein TraN [Terrimonas sp.]PVD52188.1 conjugative transposon protein TraN [Terrimonas sp.]
MKPIIKVIMILTLLIGLYFLSKAQTVSHVTKLELGKVESYQMEVTYNKTSHLIFPAVIRYVDLGSELLIAGKAEGAENVLRIKASKKDFTEETNFSVITDDGRFYNFNVVFNPSPSILNYGLLRMQKKSVGENDNDVLFEELGNNAPSLTGLIMQRIYKKNKRLIRHISADAFGIRFQLKGIYIHNGLLYFHTDLKNCSNIPFNVDFITFKVVDRKLGKRTVIQEKSLIPLRMYKLADKIADNSADQNIFLMDQFTLANDKILVIEVFEKNGGRKQILKVKNSDLIKARPIKDMFLSFD